MVSHSSVRYFIFFVFFAITVNCSKITKLSASDKQGKGKPTSNLVTVGRNVWNCMDLDACDDILGLEAILLLHQRLDDDANGNIDIVESDDFLRDELMYSDSYERQRGFHGNDKHITADELWLAWRVSEVHNWTIEDTVQWLILNVELPQYAKNFIDKSVDGTTLPRMAVNSMHFLSNLGIKDPIHKQKISVKAMDVVLFGPSKNHNYLKDALLMSSLIIGASGCWFAFIQHRRTQSHLRRTMLDMDNLQFAEQSLRKLQKELDKAKQEQEMVILEKKNLEQQLKNEKQMIQQESLIGSREDQSRVSELEEELKIVLGDLHNVEKALQDKSWVPSPGLQQWLQLTYEMELQNYNAKKAAAEQQLASAKEGCEKLRKKRSSFLGTFRVAHGSSIDDVDNRILQAKSALSEVTKDLQERLNRWKQIEALCGFAIVHNPGIRHLEFILRSGLSSMFSSTSSGASHITRTSSDGTLADDDSVSSFPTGISARSLSNLSHSDNQHSTANLGTYDSLGRHIMKNVPRDGLKSCASSGAILQREDTICSEHSDIHSTDCESVDDKTTSCGSQGTAHHSGAKFTIGESSKDFILTSPISSGLKRRNLECDKRDIPEKCITSPQENN